MCTARPGWQTVSFRWGRYKSSSYKIEVDLVDILEVDVKRQVKLKRNQIIFGICSILLLLKMRFYRIQEALYLIT